LTAPTLRKRAIIDMNRMNATEARKKLYPLLDETARDHEPLLITRPRSNAVLIAEEHWNSMEETLYLLSDSPMRKSIRAGLGATIEECEREPGW
jgi:antitoxin YefM